MLKTLKTITFVLAASSTALTITTVAAAANMASYRAVYDVRLVDAKRGSRFTAASGQIAYGVKEACDAWLVNQTGTMYLQTTTGDVFPQTLNFSSWESRDGASYRFTVMGEKGEEDTILGGAKLRKNGGGEAQFTRPDSMTFKLPANTMFPVVHTAHILRQAEVGKTQFQNTVFEGTDVEGAKLLVTFVSPLSKHARTISNALKIDALKQPGWTFRLAYFDPQSQTGEPLYEIEADYLDNGIPVRWMLDYGEFTVEMAMSKIEVLSAPKC